LRARADGRLASKPARAVAVGGADPRPQPQSSGGITVRKPTLLILALVSISLVWRDRPI
jgi:hypothetical protein